MPVLDGASPLVERRLLYLEVFIGGVLHDAAARFTHHWKSVWLTRRAKTKAALKLLLAVLSVSALSVPVFVGFNHFICSIFDLSIESKLCGTLSGSLFRLHEFPELLDGSWSLFGKLYLLVLVLFSLGVLVLLSRKLCSIPIYLLEADEPFPIIAPSRETHFFLAVRTLDPNVRARLHSYLQYRGTLFSESPKPTQITAGQHDLHPRSYPGNSLRNDVWMLVRFALTRLLGIARQESQEADVGHATSVYFAFKMHLTQFKVYALLIVGSLIIPFSGLLGAGADREQYAIILSALGFLWAYWCTWLHRRQLSSLKRWADQWARKPFSSSPIFYYDARNARSKRWEELWEPDFEVGIRRYGLENEKLLDLSLTVLLGLFLALLHVLK